MVDSFDIYLLSNTKGHKNSTSSFTVRLPRRLNFTSSWLVGITNIIYPYSWPNIGTDDQQFLEIFWSNGVSTRLLIAPKAYRTSEKLLDGLKKVLANSSQALCLVEETPAKRSRRDVNRGMDSPADSLGNVKQAEGVRDTNMSKDDLLETIETMKRQKIESDQRHHEEIERHLKAVEDAQTNQGSTIAEKDRRIRNLKEKIMQLENDKNDLEKNSQLEIDALKKSMQQLKKEMKDNEDIHKFKENEYLGRIGRIQQENANEKKDVNDEIDQLRERLRELSNEKSTADAQRNQLIEEKDKQIEKLENERRSNAQKAQSEIGNYEQRIEDLENLKKTETELLKTEVDRLTERLTQLQDDKRKSDERHENEVNTLQNRITDIMEQSKSEPTVDEAIHPVSLDSCRIANGDPYVDLHKYVVFHYDEKSERFTLKINTSHVRNVRLSPQLQYLLGFDQSTFDKPQNQAKYMPDLHGGIHTLHIYAPQLIEPTFVGDTLSPLLRITKVKGTPGDMVEDTFLSPHYHKVLDKQVSDITIEIRTSTGRLVPFNWGTCTLVLHFKKQSLF